MSDGSLPAPVPLTQPVANAAASAVAHPISGRPRLEDRARQFVAGTLLARPWFDHAALYSLKPVFFPAARGWAAAAEADGDFDRFHTAAPLPMRHERRAKLTRTLEAVHEARVAALAVERAWEQAFFGPDETPAENLRAMEAARLTLRHAYNSTRWGLRMAAPGGPRAKLAIETPDAVEAAYGGGLAAFDARSAPPVTMPMVEQSRAIITANGREYWLRFKSPADRLGDTVYAHVSEPADADNPPTLISGHGVCVDFDHWKGLIDETQTLVARGFRLIRPEAPWHGRRTPKGRYAGERTIGAFPMGLLDSFSGALQEWSVLADWARKSSKGPLMFGGSSLGAMTAQLAADRSYQWPKALRPDGLLLITHTGDMAAAVMEGALTNMWAKPEDVKTFGWTPELARRYLTLLNPVNAMPMAAANIVSILGRRDVILPFESGRRLVARWQVPAESAFVWDRGHFSVPAMLIRHRAPLDRLCEIAAHDR